MRVTRALIGLLGLVVTVVGLMKVRDLGLDGIVAALKWLIGGVVLHDGVLAPVVLVLGFLLVRRLPDWARGPAVGGFVVLGSVTLLAIPVLGRFGERADNPTLLDRNYTAGWLVLAALVAAAVAIGCWWNLKHRPQTGVTQRRNVESVQPVKARTGRSEEHR